MGRSVSTPRHAVEVFYLDYSYEITDEDLDESLEANDATDLCRHDRESWRQALESDQFDDLIEDLRFNVFGQFPSVHPADDWIGDEDHVIAENRLARFGVSEYMGLAAIWVVVHPDVVDTYGSGIGVGPALFWIEQAWPKVEAMFPNRLGLMGRFSNGEAVYRRAERTETESPTS